MIQGEEYPLGAHPKILQASVDPGVWEGKKMRESWFMEGDGSKKQLQIITFADQPGTGDQSESGNQVETGSAKDGETSQHPVQNRFPFIPVIAGLAWRLFILACLGIKKINHKNFL